ncbi:MAG: threonine synthase [Paracoccaceae bacterium]
MRYISTRGDAPILGFEDAVLTGLARDGGLYWPERFPRLEPDEIAALRGQPYERAALRVMRPFVGDAYDEAGLARLIERAYAVFRHPARAPLVQVGPADWLLELHHGPTLAFKDFAMQIVARWFEDILARRRGRATIVCATSGDTGSAAMEAFRGLDRVDVVVLYPHGRVSDVQRRQMTTPSEPNVHALAVEGTFDDCQALVKAMFADERFRAEVALGAVNSINWGRVLAQVVYYFTAAAALGAPERPVSFSVPTGNFGDVLAGEVARRMGLPISTLVVATNENDILHRAMTGGIAETRAVEPTVAPSMDIQVSSNFERLLFELMGRDGRATARAMAESRESGRVSLPRGARERLAGGWASARSDRATTLSTIERIARETGQVIDPHTAIGVHAARECRRDPSEAMVTLATAHAAKFPDAVVEACGQHPALPAHLADLYARPERVARVANDLVAVQAAIRERCAVGA